MPTSQWTSVQTARQRILSDIKAVGETIETPLEDALMRIIGGDVLAPFNVPGHDNSAMDGFACRFADVQGDAGVLSVVGESFAGHPYTGAFGAGECVKIMTGARLPDGTEIVVPQEETAVADDARRVTVLANAQRRHGLHTRRAGEDLAVGDKAATTGTLCTPAVLGLLASLGMRQVTLKRRLRVAFFSTGDEIRTAGETLGDSDVYDSNRHTLRAMIERMNFSALDFGVVGDNKEALAETMTKAAADADVIITSGGASVGEADHIRTVLAECGDVLFWKVAMRPGRPLAYGKIGETDFFGLPGNPVSVMVCFYQFVREALWRRAGRLGDITPPTLSATTTTALRKSPGRTEFQRGMLTEDGDGERRVTVTGEQGSGILSSMARANCFIILPEECGAVAAGAVVQVQPFDGIV